MNKKTKMERAKAVFGYLCKEQFCRDEKSVGSALADLCAGGGQRVGSDP